MNSRISDIMEGAKHGAIKKGIDTAVDKISTPAISSIKDKIGSDNPVVAGLTESAIKFIISLGIAEAISSLGPQIGSLISNDGEDISEKSQLLSTYMRKYAGERLGSEAIEATLVFLPEILSSLKSIKTEDIKYVLGEKSQIHEEKLPENVEEAVAPSIFSKLAQEEQLTK